MTEFTPSMHLVKPDFNVATWHTEINGNFDTIDALFFAITGITGVLGPWLNNTAYVIGNRVLDTDSSRLYEAKVNHTSAITGTFLQDRTANPTFWEIISVGVPDPFAVPGDFIVGGNLHVIGTSTLGDVTMQSYTGCDLDRIGYVSEFAGSIAPPRTVFCFGQSLLVADHPLLFAVIGYTYGGAGASFNVPDCRDRVTVGLGNMGGVSADRITMAGAGFDSDVIGAIGGFETHTLITNQTPIHNHTGPSHVHTGTTGNNSVNHTHTFSDVSTNASVNHQHGGGPVSSVAGGLQTSLQGGAANGGSDGTDQPSGSLHTHTVSGTTAVNSVVHTHGFTSDAAGTGVTGDTGGGLAHNNVQPTIVMPKIIYTGVL